MVFAGTHSDEDAIYRQPGFYDPVYPPGEVNLNWWYKYWPTNHQDTTFSSYIGHVGEYNGAFSDEQHVNLTWADYRLASPGTIYPRSQSDIRSLRLAWP